MAKQQEDFFIKYFPLHCNIWDDEKIIKLTEKFPNALGLYILILCKLYPTSGYYLHWSETICEIFCKRHKLQQRDVEDFIFESVEIGLFDKLCFFNYSILTSKRIQRTCFDIFPRRRFFKFEYKLFLLNPNDYIRDKSNKGYGIVILLNEDNNEIIGELPPRPILINTYPIYQKSTLSVKIDLFHNERNEDTEYIQIPSQAAPANQYQPQPPQINTSSPWDEIVRFSRMDYGSLPDHVKEEINEPYFCSYFRIIERIDNNYSSLHKHNNPITWKEWKFFLKGCPYSEAQVHGGLEKMAASNIPEHGTMMATLVRYIKWYIEEQEPKLNGVKITSNPNNVPLLTPNYRK